MLFKPSCIASKGMVIAFGIVNFVKNLDTRN